MHTAFISHCFCSSPFLEYELEQKEKKIILDLPVTNVLGMFGFFSFYTNALGFQW